MLAHEEEVNPGGIRPLFLVMDNASIHKGPIVQEALAQVSPRLQVAYLPPYAPTFNPIELVNAQLKRGIQGRRENLQEGELETAIGEEVGKVKEEQIKAYYGVEGYK